MPAPRAPRILHGPSTRPHARAHRRGVVRRAAPADRRRCWGYANRQQLLGRLCLGGLFRSSLLCRPHNLTPVALGHRAARGRARPGMADAHDMAQQVRACMEWVCAHAWDAGSRRCPRSAPRKLRSPQPLFVKCGRRQAAVQCGSLHGM